MGEAMDDAMWKVLRPLIEAVRPRARTPHHDLRRTVAAIIWRHRNGAAWRSVPAELGPWWAAAQTFIRWAEGAGGDRADAGHRGEQVLGRAPSRGAADLVVDLAVEFGQRGLQGGQGPLDAAKHLRAASLAAAVALHPDHLDDLARGYA